MTRTVDLSESAAEDVASALYNILLSTKFEAPRLESSCSSRRIDVSLYFHPDDPSMTRQEFKDECDINGIMARYEKAGGQFPFADRPPMYLDLTQTPSSLMEAMNTMIDAENAFMSLPAHVRKEFDNDAMRFVEFASDDKNLEKMREWKLAPPAKEPEKPIRVQVENPPPIVPADKPPA